MDHFSRESGSGNLDMKGTGSLRREKFESLVRETINELYSNALYWDFFKSFNEDSIHDFISEYATRKAWYLVNGERAVANITTDALRFREIAEKCFWEIQQKKLFNIQAEWRAGLIEIKNIETTRDFLCWEHAIASCPFLEPVTRAEIELYLEYLDSGEFREKNWLYHWQDYEVYRNQTTEQDAIPVWYRFYDSKMGTGYLMLLPDKKGNSEQQYIKTWRDKLPDGEFRSHTADESLSSPGPNLNVNYQSLDFFIRTFESKQMLRYFQTMELCPEDSAIEAELQDALRILNRASENIRLPEASDWRTAVIEGARKYKTSNVRTNLLRVYEEYLFLVKNGISPNEPGDRFEYEEQLAIALTYKEQIEAGKKITEE